MPFPLNESYIAATEEKLGVCFPDSFRKKMMKANGGNVATPPDAWELFPFLDSSDRKRLSRTCNDIVRETEVSRRWAGFPEDAIAIGSNVGGDKLIFLKDPANPRNLSPAVYWWDHETGEITRVARDFSELREA